MVRKLRGLTQHEFAEIDKSIGKTQKGLNNLGAREYKVRVDSSELDEARRKLDNMSRGGGGIGNIFKGTALGMMAGNAVSGLLGSAMDFGKDVLGGGMQMGANKMRFEVLAGKQEGGQLFGELQQYVRESVFGPELYGSASQMMAFGIAAKDVMPTMKMLGDVSMGDAEKLSSLTLAFSQTTAAGKLMGQDLLQYVNAGFNPLQVISERTGKSMATLKKEMSQGAISAQMVKEAFEAATGPGGKFHDMIKKVSNTPFGKWQKITGSWNDAKAGIGFSQDAALGRIFDHLNKFVDELPGIVTKMAPVVERMLNAFDDIMPSIKDFGKSLVELLKPIGGIFMSGEFKSAAKSIANFARELDYALLPIVKLLSAGFRGLLGWLPESKDAKRARALGEDVYYFKNVADSVAVDDAKMQSIIDSVTGSIGLRPKKFFKSFKEFQAYLQEQGELANHGYASKQFVQGIFDVPTMKADPDKAKKMAGMSGAEEASSAITGGGQRVMSINFRNFVENLNNNFNTKDEAMASNTSDLRHMLAQVLAGVPAF